MHNLNLKSFGPIKHANVTFGDLTLLVGPQASGKSLFVQILKLLIDKQHIQNNLMQYGYDWNRKNDNFLELYFGEGMSAVWKPNCEVKFNDEPITKNFLRSDYPINASETQEQMFYIPAQRILSVAAGRPKLFTEFDSETPYVLRQFSETVRQFLQKETMNSNSIFPSSGILKKTLRDSFNNSIFHNGKVVMDNKSGQKKIRMEVDGMNIPFMTWSAGQKEFMPLLLGFYWLCPPSKVSMRANFKFVVLEEPEMGLHPEAIISVLLQVIDLMSRGYKVIVSSHSPVFLEFAWAFNLLQKVKAPSQSLLQLFNLPNTDNNPKLFKGLLESKNIKSYYFNREGNHVNTKDITTLDAGNEDKDIAEWGGLTGFASKAADIVSDYY